MQPHSKELPLILRSQVVREEIWPEMFSNHQEGGKSHDPQALKETQAFGGECGFTLLVMTDGQCALCI